MDLSLKIVPIGNTTSREIAAMSRELQETLERSRDVSIEPHHMPAPDGSKGVFVAVLGSFALSVAPKVFQGVLEAVRAVLARQPALTEVMIETKDGKFSFKFDPRKIALGELVEAAERLRALAPPA
jgi:hypothetical protein